MLLTHTGGTFCAGADLKEATSPQGPGRLVALLRAVVELPKPVVAHVRGHVRAGGLGLLAACDVPVAGPGASFAFTEARLGLAPAVISLTVLPRMDARAAARHYLTGEVFDTAEAVRTGLVAAPEEALDGILAGLRAASPQGLAESKALTTAAVLRGFDRDAEALTEQSARLFGSSEAARVCGPSSNGGPRHGRCERHAHAQAGPQPRHPAAVAGGRRRVSGRTRLGGQHGDGGRGAGGGVAGRGAAPLPHP